MDSMSQLVLEAAVGAPNWKPRLDAAIWNWLN
jgi:hypothetical protein